jgi:predicted XRE-type DNA-binding protein
MRTHPARGRIEVEESSGNVFKDLGVPNPDKALVKAKLALHITKIVEKNGWKQDEAARRMGVDQPKVSKILRGQLREFSIDRLLGFLRAVGCEVEIVLKNGTGSPAAFRVVEEQHA